MKKIIDKIQQTYQDSVTDSKCTSVGMDSRKCVFSKGLKFHNLKKFLFMSIKSSINR